MPTKITTEDFIKKSKSVHGSKYTYSNTVYTNSKSKVLITCRKCSTEFSQRADSHLQGSGCHCQASKTRVYWSTSSFIEQSKRLFGNQFDYSAVEYTGVHDKITLTCALCNKTFTQEAINHLRSKGCNNCYNISKTTTYSDFIIKATDVHGDKYSYGYTPLLPHRSKVDILCKKCNTIFTQHVHIHLRGSGCPSCAPYGFDITKPAILYYISINNGEAYKIGVTNNTIAKRFSNDIKLVTLLKVWEFPVGGDAYAKEQEILKTYSNFMYKGVPLLKNGNTEMFTHDVLASSNTC